mmetsp:Transcript_38228/g.97742  ORF Transcript_38228/g.97742 Transcript_38228/m.97742 type:complete len:127 (-) Transcript_38228:291-671(-)
MEIRKLIQHVVEEEDIGDAGAVRPPHEDEEEDFPPLPATLGRGGYLLLGFDMYDLVSLLPEASRVDGRTVPLEDGEDLDGDLMVRKYARNGRGGKPMFGGRLCDLTEVGSPIGSDLMHRKYARYLQ